jgi:hypothetical protein
LGSLPPVFLYISRANRDRNFGHVKGLLCFYK